MADRAQQMSRPPLGALTVAALLVGLSGGTLLVVALRAKGFHGLASSDWAALRFTVSQALVSAAFSVALAIPAARALARRRFRGRNALVLLLGVPFVLPVIVAVLGLLAVFGRAGILSAVIAPLGLGPLNIYGFHGVVLAHVFLNLPLATRLILQGWATIPAERFALAAGLGMSGRDVFNHLERPMLRGILPGVFTIVFLLCVTSFAVALTLGGGPRATTLELAIYQAFRFDFDLSGAATLAVLQLMLSAGAAALAWWLAASVDLGAGLDRPLRRWDSGARGLVALDGVVLGAVSLFLLLPMGMIVLGGIGALWGLEPAVLGAALRSILVALCAAALTLGASLSLSLAIARSEMRRPVRAGLLEATGYLAVAASPMVVGTGLFIVIFPFVDPTLVALPLTALVNAMMSMPFALRALLPAIRVAERDYSALSASLGLSGGEHFRIVLWPRVRRDAGFAAGLAAALSMGDLGVVALFADPDAATLPLVMYRLMAAYRMDDAGGAALLLVILSLFLFWMFDRMGRANA